MEGTTDDEMMRACEAVEEQMAAEAVAEGNGANAKDGAEADDDVRKVTHIKVMEGRRRERTWSAVV